MVKNLPAMKETQVQSLGQEDPLEKGMATHYNILAHLMIFNSQLSLVFPLFHFSCQSQLTHTKTITVKWLSQRECYTRKCTPAEPRDFSKGEITLRVWGLGELIGWSELGLL